jgi:1-acyl-sn-glycerol-3-phosphate acyltransferase
MLILVRPHTSRLDGPAVAWYLSKVSRIDGALFAVDPDFARHPVYGPLLRAYGKWVGGHTMVPMDATSQYSLRTLLKALIAGKPVVIFPQGTGLKEGPDRPDMPGVDWLVKKSGAPVMRLTLDHTTCIPVVHTPETKDDIHAKHAS